MEGGSEVEDENIYDFPGKSTSFVWGHFGFMKKDGKLDKEKAVCHICKRSYKYHGVFFNFI